MTDTTTRYLHLTGHCGVLTFRLPDVDWLADRATRGEETSRQTHDIVTLGESLCHLLGGRRNRALDVVAYLHDSHGRHIPLAVEYHTTPSGVLDGIRFVRDDTDPDARVVLEYDLIAHHVIFRELRRS